MSKHEDRIALSERGAWTSIIVYILLSSFKLISGYFFASSSLMADGMNNFTDVVSSVTVLIGLKTAKKPADQNHPYGHWKAEPIASLITSFIMLFIGIQLLMNTTSSFLNAESTEAPSMVAGIVSLIAMVVMFIVSRHNHQLAEKSKSQGLKAVAKDNFVDGLTSLATAVAIFTAALGLGWVDNIMAIFISIIIIKTGIEIFRETTFLLSDGFDEETLAEYKERLQTIEEIHSIPQIKARMYGANTYVDITILVDAHMTVQQSHDITEKVERLLYEEFDVIFTDVHVEPHNITTHYSKEQV